jgi:hypothetical protein
MRHDMLVVLAFAAAWPAALAGQAVQGRVVDAVTRQPVSTVLLRLLEGEKVLAETTTDSAGRFELRPAQRGQFRVTATRIGYANATSNPVDLRTAQDVTLELLMQGEAVKVAPLTLNAPRDRYLESRGFYDRMQSGTGDFMTGDQVRRRNAQSLADLLRGMRGVKIQRVNSYNEIYLTGTNCLPMIVVDGVTVRWGGRTTPSRTLQPLEDLVAVGHIDGIEVYRGGSGLPQEFNGPNASCGVILIWTSHK